MRLKAFAATLIILASQAAFAQGQEDKDIGLANVAIVSDIVLGANPHTRFRCSETLCLGVSQAEIGLALIAARDTQKSARALSGLIRFKLDGSLAEDFNCFALRKRHLVRNSLLSTNPAILHAQCIADYNMAVVSHADVFPPKDFPLVCRSETEMIEVKSDLLEMLRSSKSCQNQ